MNLLILLAFLVFSVFRGYRKGIIIILFGLTGLLMAYLTSWLLTIPMGDLLISMNVMHGLFAYMLSGFLIFMFISLSFSVTGFFVHRAFMGGRRRAEIHKGFWLSGSVVNSLTGIIYGLALIWTLGQLQASGRGGWIERSSSAMVGALSRVVTNRVFENQPEMGKQVSEIIANPQESATRLKNLVDSESFSSFFKNPAVHEIMQENDASKLAGTSAFQNMIKDPAVREQLEHFGLYSEEKGGEEAFAGNIISLWNQATKLKPHPRARAILNSPDYAQLLKNNDVVAMMRDNRTLELIEIMGQPDQGNAPSGLESSKPESMLPSSTKAELSVQNAKVKGPENAKKKSKLYSWRDENGKLFISDHPPKEKDSEPSR